MFKFLKRLFGSNTVEVKAVETRVEPRLKMEPYKTPGGVTAKRRAAQKRSVPVRTRPSALRKSRVKYDSSVRVDDYNRPLDEFGNLITDFFILQSLQQNHSVPYETPAVESAPAPSYESHHVTPSHESHHSHSYSDHGHSSYDSGSSSGGYDSGGSSDSGGGGCDGGGGGGD